MFDHEAAAERLMFVSGCWRRSCVTSTASLAVWRRTLTNPPPSSGEFCSIKPTMFWIRSVELTLSMFSTCDTVTYHQYSETSTTADRLTSVVQVNALLPTDTFIVVMRGLMGNQLASVRRKAMELLNNKLQHRTQWDEQQVSFLHIMENNYLLIDY